MLGKLSIHDDLRSGKQPSQCVQSTPAICTEQTGLLRDWKT